MKTFNERKKEWLRESYQNHTGETYRKGEGLIIGGMLLLLIIMGVIK